MARYNGVNHLAMATGDMDRTIRFWRDLLGMRLVATLGHPGYRHYFFEISDTDLIAFFEWDGVEPLPEKDHGRPVTGPYVFDHVSIGVEDEADLWDLKDRLAAADFWVSEVVDHGFIHSLYTFDPNGIALEFSHAVEEVNIRREPIFRDTEPSEITREGSEPGPQAWPPVNEPTPASERRVYPGMGSEIFQGYKKGEA